MIFFNIVPLEFSMHIPGSFPLIKASLKPLFQYSVKLHLHTANGFQTI